MMDEVKQEAGTIASLRLKRFGETATIPRDCPWIDPPEWFLEKYGLQAWGELLTEQWKAAARKPKTARQKQMEE